MLYTQLVCLKKLLKSRHRANIEGKHNFKPFCDLDKYLSEQKLVSVSIRLFVSSIMLTKTFLKKEHCNDYEILKDQKIKIIIKHNLVDEWVNTVKIRIVFYTVFCNGSILYLANQGGFWN